MGTRSDANTGANTGRRRHGRKISQRASALSESMNELIRESMVTERAAREVCRTFITGLKSTHPTTRRIMKRIMELE